MHTPACGTGALCVCTQLVHPQIKGTLTSGPGESNTHQCTCASLICALVHPKFGCVYPTKCGCTGAPTPRGTCVPCPDAAVPRGPCESMCPRTDTPVCPHSRTPEPIPAPRHQCSHAQAHQVHLHGASSARTHQCIPVLMHPHTGALRHKCTYSPGAPTHGWSKHTENIK